MVMHCGGVGQTVHELQDIEVSGQLWMSRRVWAHCVAGKDSGLCAAQGKEQGQERRGAFARLGAPALDAHV